LSDDDTLILFELLERIVQNLDTPGGENRVTSKSGVSGRRTSVNTSKTSTHAGS
jgi:hypothetical protein